MRFLFYPYVKRIVAISLNGLIPPKKKTSVYIYEMNEFPHMARSPPVPLNEVKIGKSRVKLAICGVDIF